MMMKIPFVDLQTQYELLRPELDPVMQEVIQRSAFIGGKYVNSFEQHFAEYLGVKHCISVGNGTDALYVALTMLGLKAGDEVITPANSFIASSEAITRTGARVVFVDCHPETLLIDVTAIERAITPNTKAIMPVHLYGQPAEMDVIMTLAKKHHLAVVEDAAQAHGAEYHGHKAGTLGDCACFSFYPSKNLGAYGDGGAIVTNNDDLARKMKMFANHGRIEKYDHEFEGINSRLDGLQAAILDVKLRFLDQWNARRRAIAARYDAAFAGLVKLTTVQPNVSPVYHLYVVRVSRRDIVQKRLAERGIATGIHYPIPLPFLKAYVYLGHTPEDFPVASAAKDELLSLPMYDSMTDEQVAYVIHEFTDILKKEPL